MVRIDLPFVSAILPVYNRAGSIERAIESVFAQSYRPLELIVVDDGSDDETTHILAKYKSVATVLRQPNQGAYAARNLALRHAKGDLIAFIDSDDAWLPDKLERQVPLMREKIGLVYGDIEIVATPESGAPRIARTKFNAVMPHRGDVLEALAWGNFVPTCTALVRREALESIGGFDEQSRISADYLAWYAIARYHQFDYVAAPVAVYTRHAGGISYDLGRSLAARIRLFQGERAKTSNAAHRNILDRLLFNLGCHLAIAAVRGRARSVERPLRLAREAAAALDTKARVRSAIGFAGNQVKLRARRILA